MTDLKVYDNAIDQGLYLKCLKAVEQSKSFTALHNGGDGSFGFKYSWAVCEDGVEFVDPIFKELWQTVSQQLPKNIRLHRSYVNAHSYGVEDSIHVDEMDLKSGITVIVYLCASWYPEWFGQTAFFKTLNKHENEIVASIMPKPNRYVIFDKDIPHCVTPLSRRFAGVRFTCMFKVELV